MQIATVWQRSRRAAYFIIEHDPTRYFQLFADDYETFRRFEFALLRESEPAGEILLQATVPCTDDFEADKSAALEAIALQFLRRACLAGDEACLGRLALDLRLDGEQRLHPLDRLTRERAWVEAQRSAALSFNPARRRDRGSKGQGRPGRRGITRPARADFRKDGSVESGNPRGRLGRPPRTASAGRRFTLAARGGGALKSGRYRYYTCSIKARQGETGCTGRSIPMDRLDDIVAGHIENRLLSALRRC